MESSPVSRRWAGAAGAAAVSTTLLLFLGSCGDGQQPTGSGATASGKQSAPSASAGAKPATLEGLARRAHCELTVDTDAHEIRQGVCGKGSKRLVLATFSSAGGQRAWLAEAKPYGGTYLVGTRWLAVGDESRLRSLQGKLGGELERGEEHTTGRPGSSHEGHSAHDGH